MAFKKGPTMPTAEGGEPASGNPFAPMKGENQRRCYRVAGQDNSQCPGVLPVKAPPRVSGGKAGRLR